MALLAIDTTGSDCSVALRVAGQPDLCRSDPIGRGHAEYLAPMIAGMLDEAGLQAAQLTRIGVMTGPGSFCRQPGRGGLRPGPCAGDRRAGCRDR